VGPLHFLKTGLKATWGERHSLDIFLDRPGIVNAGRRVSLPFFGGPFISRRRR